MKLDDTTKEALVEIQNELKIDGEDISIQEIANIVESQFIAGNLAFKKGLEVRLPFFGSFTRKHGLEKSKAAQELNKLKDSLTKEEYNKRVFKAKMSNKEKAKHRRNIARSTKLTFEDLQETKNVVGVANIYDKIL